MFLLQATTDSTAPQIIEEATKNVNALARWWDNIDWDALIATIIDKGIMLLLLIVLFAIINRAGKKIIDKTYKRYSQRQNVSTGRLDTINTLINNVFQYTLFFFLIYSLLSVLGVPVGSLLAGAGIAGVAIGLGAQGFMTDIITGLFILIEQQMDVGDYIRLLNLGIEGTVISVGIRSTQLKGADGTIHYIPNRNITTISNTSRANMQILIDVRIIPDEGYDKIQTIIESVNEKLAPKYEEQIQTGPTLFGLVDLGNGNFAIRTIMYVLNGQQFAIKEDFLSEYVSELSQAGFTIPNTPIVLP